MARNDDTTIGSKSRPWPERENETEVPLKHRRKILSLSCHLPYARCLSVETNTVMPNISLTLCQCQTASNGNKADNQSYPLPMGSHFKLEIKSATFPATSLFDITPPYLLHFPTCFFCFDKTFDLLLLAIRRSRLDIF